jgi:hypothetical protein
MSVFERILGGSPFMVLLKLVVASLLVGIVLAALGWSPRDIYAWVIDLALSIWNMGFAALGRFGEYILVGAAIVVPIYVVMRLLRFRT